MLARSTTLPNCSSVLLSWPLTTTVAEMPWPADVGQVADGARLDTCAFCERMAADHLGRRQVEALTSLFGSIQTRIAALGAEELRLADTRSRAAARAATLREA